MSDIESLSCYQCISQHIFEQMYQEVAIATPISDLTIGATDDCASELVLPGSHIAEGIFWTAGGMHR